MERSAEDSEIADNHEPRQRPNPEGLGLMSDIVQRLSDYGTTTRQDFRGSRSQKLTSRLFGKGDAPL